MIRVMRVLLLMTVLFTESSSLSAKSDNPVVIFFYGDVTIFENSNKKISHAYIGMVLNGKSVVKTGINSMVQLRINEFIYTIKDETTATIENIKKLSPDSGDNVIRALFDKSRNRYKTMSAGIRAEEKTDNITWSEDSRSEEERDSTIDLLEGMKAFISMDDYNKAVSLYEKNRGVKGEFSLNCSYFAAISYLNLCQYQKAGILFDVVADSADHELGPEALYNSGLCSYSLLDYKKAITQLRRYLNNNSAGKFAPQAYFLLGKSHSAMNNEAAASESFKTLLDKFSTDPIAVDAEDEYRKITR